MAVKNALRKIWCEAFSIIMKVYHQLAPRFKVIRKLYGIRYELNINDHISFILSPFDWEPDIKNIVTQKWGVVWDVGSNFGLFSILAEKAGNKVIAFDPSELAIDHLNTTKAINRCSNLITISKPLASKKVRYKKVKDASCTNVMFPFSHCVHGIDAITYKEAEAKYGTPNLIKMDIEGGEKAFLEHPGFIQWLDKKKISMIVELHHGYVPHTIDHAHVNALTRHHIFLKPFKKGTWT